jgi:hypothetical protein
MAFAFSRKSVSETRSEVGQLILTTRGIPGHWVDVALSTSVDLPTIAGSSEIASASLTLNNLGSAFPKKCSSFNPFCTTQFFRRNLVFETSSAFFGTLISRIPFFSSERQWKAITVAMKN